jgi:hypothetical protein
MMPDAEMDLVQERARGSFDQEPTKTKIEAVARSKTYESKRDENVMPEKKTLDQIRISYCRKVNSMRKDS